MSKLKANYGTPFILIPEGEQVLKIKSVKLVPSGKPKDIIVSFSDVNGGSLENKYSLSVDAAVFAFCMLYKFATKTSPDEIDLDKLSDILVGQYVLTEIVHNEGSKPNESGEKIVFANLKKVIGHAEGFDGSVVDEKIETTLDDDEDDEIAVDLDDDEDDDDDLPFIN